MTNPETPQNADSNTPKWFVATICREQHDLAYIRIQANSREEAEAKASKYTGELIYDWDTVTATTGLSPSFPTTANSLTASPAWTSRKRTTTPNDGGQDNE